MTHVDAIEEISNGQQRREDASESFVLHQLLHPLLQILQWLGHFLSGEQYIISGPKQNSRKTCVLRVCGKTGAPRLPLQIICSRLRFMRGCLKVGPAP